MCGAIELNGCHILFFKFAQSRLREERERERERERETERERERESLSSQVVCQLATATELQNKYMEGSVSATMK